MNEYTQQAEQFLTDTGTTFGIEYLYTGLHFHTDTEPRDIYQFTLKNARGAYSAKFGDSIHNTERRQFIKECRYGATLTNPDVQRAKRLQIGVTGSFTVKRKDYRAIADYKPTAYDILACMSSYCPDTFGEFCDEYGYTDQPLTEHDNVMRTFLSVKEENAAMVRMFTTEQLDQLAEIA